MTDNKELEAQVKALKKELADLKAAQKPPEPPKAEIPKELAEKIEAQDKTLKELSARLEKIEKAPEDPKTKGAGEEPKELGLPEYFVLVNRKTGVIGGGD